jgi:hypothetical protein
MTPVWYSAVFAEMLALAILTKYLFVQAVWSTPMELLGLTDSYGSCPGDR